jgi:hypothetical protein
MTDSSGNYQSKSAPPWKTFAGVGLWAAATAVNAIGPVPLPAHVVGIAQGLGALLGTVGVIDAQGKFKSSSVRLIGAAMPVLPSWLVTLGGVAISAVHLAGASPTPDTLAAKVASVGTAAGVAAIATGWRLWLHKAGEVLHI